MAGLPPAPPIPARPAGRPLALILPLLKTYRLRLGLGILALIGVDLCQLVIPRVIKASVDALSLGTSSPARLLRQGGTVVGLAVGIAACRYLWRILILGVSRFVERDLRERLFRHLLTLDRSFFQKNSTGELMALSSNDLAAVQMAAGMGLIAMVDSVVMSGAAILFMLYINRPLTLIALSPLPLLVVLTKFLTRRLHLRFTTVQETFSLLTEQARSAINAIRLVKIYSREADQTARFDRTGRDYIGCSMQVAAIQGLLFPAAGLVANISLLLVVILGGRMAIERLITIGDLVAFISYLFMLVWPMMAIGWVVNLFQRGLTSLGRLGAVLAARPLLDGADGGEPLPERIESLELHNLDFTYPGESQPVLSGISLRLTPGLYGVVGPTGSGKTSLCQVLARLYPLADGNLLLNGRDGNRLSVTAYRRRVAYAPQEPFLFSDTIAANIAFGRPEATPREIEAVARRVAIHDEIMGFAAGYDSRLGEKGVTLSGGQRQRLSLARALLTEAPILLIDDSLSAVDSATERHILAAIQDYAAQGRIVVMTSHRLAQVAGARLIAVLAAGRLDGLGRREELIATNGYFRAVYQKQSASREAVRHGA